MRASKLILKNNTVFNGFSPDCQSRIAFGEVVFTTGMTGYVETLTDPSYAGQIINFTYPLIGNYGIPPKENWESKKIYASGVIVSEACSKWSHHEGIECLLNWLNEQNVPIITGADTRALTKLLREYGTMTGVICSNEEGSASIAREKLDSGEESLKDMVKKVSIKEKQIYNERMEGFKKIIAVDCGMKENIIRSLQKLPFEIHRVPYNYNYTNENFDAIFLSNGPGDPTECQETIKILKKAMEAEKPIFGICLGSQIMALASGAKTYKLPYGHRGQNQPCINTVNKQCVVTSQNHGYAVDEKTLPDGWYASYRNLNDGSVEGISHEKLPFSSVQFHPEACPGPTDTSGMFADLYNTIIKYGK